MKNVKIISLFLVISIAQSFEQNNNNDLLNNNNINQINFAGIPEFIFNNNIVQEAFQINFENNNFNVLHDAYVENLFITIDNDPNKIETITKAIKEVVTKDFSFNNAICILNLIPEDQVMQISNNSLEIIWQHYFQKNPGINQNDKKMLLQKIISLAQKGNIKFNNDLIAKSFESFIEIGQSQLGNISNEIIQMANVNGINLRNLLDEFINKLSYGSFDNIAQIIENLKTLYIDDLTSKNTEKILNYVLKENRKDCLKTAIELFILKNNNNINNDIIREAINRLFQLGIEQKRNDIILYSIQIGSQIDIKFPNIYFFKNQKIQNLFNYLQKNDMVNLYKNWSLDFDKKYIQCINEKNNKQKILALEFARESLANFIHNDHKNKANHTLIGNNFDEINYDFIKNDPYKFEINIAKSLHVLNNEWNNIMNDFGNFFEQENWSKVQLNQSGILSDFGIKGFFDTGDNSQETKKIFRKYTRVLNLIKENFDKTSLAIALENSAACQNGVLNTLIDTVNYCIIHNGNQIDLQKSNIVVGKGIDRLKNNEFLRHAAELISLRVQREKENAILDGAIGNEAAESALFRRIITNKFIGGDQINVSMNHLDIAATYGSDLKSCLNRVYGCLDVRGMISIAKSALSAEVNITDEEGKKKLSFLDKLGRSFVQNGIYDDQQKLVEVYDLSGKNISESWYEYDSLDNFLIKPNDCFAAMVLESLEYIKKLNLENLGYLQIKDLEKKGYIQSNYYFNK